MGQARWVLDSLAGTRGHLCLRPGPLTQEKQTDRPLQGRPAPRQGCPAPRQGCWPPALPWDATQQGHTLVRELVSAARPYAGTEFTGRPEQINAACLRAGWPAGTQVSIWPQDPRSLPLGPDRTPVSLDASRQKPRTAAHTGDQASFPNAGRPPGAAWPP